MKYFSMLLTIILSCACVDNQFFDDRKPQSLDFVDAHFMARATTKTDMLQLFFRGNIDVLSLRKFYFIKNPSKETLPFSSGHRALTKLGRSQHKNTVIVNLDSLEIGEKYGLYWNENEKPLQLLQYFTKYPRQKILTHNLGLLRNPTVPKHQRLFLFSVRNAAEISPISQVSLEEESTKENILPANTVVTFSKNTLQIILPKKDPPLFKEGSRYRLRFNFLRDNFFDEQIVQKFLVENKT